MGEWTMSNVWQRFQDPVWRKAAESRPQGTMGMAWGITKTDDKKQRQYKQRVTDFLFKSNLNEELLMTHPSPDDVKFFMDLRQLAIWDYFDASDISKLAHIERKVVREKKSLSEQNLKFINDSISRAQRLQHKNIKRIQGGDIHRREQYKAQVKIVYQDIK
jgi:hypothetical protein